MFIKPKFILVHFQETISNKVFVCAEETIWYPIFKVDISFLQTKFFCGKYCVLE